jgi:hypothetical protein
MAQSSASAVQIYRSKVESQAAMMIQTSELLLSLVIVIRVACSIKIDTARAYDEDHSRVFLVIRATLPMLGPTAVVKS